jgi:hypothetical protein
MGTLKWEDFEYVLREEVDMAGIDYDPTQPYRTAIFDIKAALKGDEGCAYELGMQTIEFIRNMRSNPQVKHASFLLPGSDGVYFRVEITKGISNQRNLNTALHQQELLNNPPFDTLDAPLRERVLDLDAVPQTPEVVHMKEQIALGRQLAILSKESLDLARRYAGKQVSCGAGHKLDAVWLANLIATKPDRPRFYLSCGCTLSRETIERKLGEL